MGDVDFGAAMALSDGVADDMSAAMMMFFYTAPRSLCQADHVRCSSIVRLSNGKDSEQDRIAVYYGENGRKADQQLRF